MEKLSHLIDSKPIDLRKKQQILHVLKTEIYPETVVIPVKICEFPQLKESEKENEISTVDEKEEDKSKCRNRRARSRRSLRYMTQPITLLEIREIDETDGLNTNENLLQNNTCLNKEVDRELSNEPNQKDSILNKIFNDLQMTDSNMRNRYARKSFRKFN